MPAAGIGSRLGASTPKFLVPVLGRTMLQHLVGLYRRDVARIALVVAPAAADAAREQTRGVGVPVDVAVQERPTGMLDAVLAGRDSVERAGGGRVWVTWCDQIAIHPRTVERLAQLSQRHPDAAIVMPTAERRNPYIHFERDRQGRIARVRHRREGDTMPAVGESDAGLFSLSRQAYLDDLPAFAADDAAGGVTGERNFLPFIPWIARTRAVVTFPCIDEREAVGINTPAELALIASYLQERGA